LQDYVNEYPDVLTDAVRSQLPADVRELRLRIQWVSPLRDEDYREYRDADFLQRVGLLRFAKELAEFWPGMGPSWDGLGILSDANGRINPGVILVEAKSHIAEIYGPGCQADAESLVKIKAALAQTRAWCGASTEANWLGPLNQSANRIAHLYLISECLRTPAWLVNLYFVADPIGPVDRPRWEREVANIKNQLGLNGAIKNMIEVYLPALDQFEVRICSACPKQLNQGVIAEPLANDGRFETWADRWMELATFPGPQLIEPEQKIAQVLKLWEEPVPGSWERGMDKQLLGTSYRRGDFKRPRLGEHAIEHQILSQLADVRCLDGIVVDGINAMPLARDESGGRRGNIEGDLLLLTERDGAYQLVICEVKESSDTCWYAAIENLRQLRLLHLSNAARRLFHHRNPHLDLPEEIPMIGLVVAPSHYYARPGKNSNVFPHAVQLLNQFTAKNETEAYLATWDPAIKSIRRFPLPI
jgi:hypothetical protein